MRTDDVLVGVGDMSVEGMGAEEAIKVLGGASRPVELHFRRHPRHRTSTLGVFLSACLCQPPHVFRNFLAVPVLGIDYTNWLLIGVL